MNIYLSCTDIEGDAELIRRQLRQLNRRFVTDRSTFGARSGSLEQVIIAELTRSDLFIGILASSHQTVDDRLPLCELEYREALRLGVPRLFYLQKDFATQSANVAFHQLIEKNDLPAFYQDTSALLAQILTDLYNLAVCGLPEKPGESTSAAGTTLGTPLTTTSPNPIQPAKDPEPIEWYNAWKNWLGRTLFPHSPIVRGLLQAILIPLIVVAVAFKLYGVPKPISDPVGKLADDAAIFFGAPPRSAQESISDHFRTASLDPTKWSGGGAWRLIGAASPDKHDTLLMTGSDVGILRLPDRFESYYDVNLSFQIPIVNPEKQGSVDWLVRLQRGLTGDSYYRFTLRFPNSVTQQLQLSSALYAQGRLARIIEEKPPIQFYPFVRKGSVLSVITIVKGSSFNISVRYSDNCFDPPCTQYNDGTKHDFYFEDALNTLKWGLVGFSNSEDSPEADLQNVQLIPTVSATNGH